MLRPTDHDNIRVHHTHIPVFAMGLEPTTIIWFSPWAWDAQRAGKFKIQNSKLRIQNFEL
jgi:hypothetical protein